MSYFETTGKKLDERMHKESVQSTRVNAETSLSGTLSTSRNCQGQDPQDLWDSELQLPHPHQPFGEQAKQQLRVHLGDQEYLLDMRNQGSFERSIGHILASRAIEEKLGMAIKIILLEKWGSRGAHFRPLQEKLIQQYTNATFKDVPAP